MTRLNRRDAMIRVSLGTAGLLCLPGSGSATPKGPPLDGLMELSTAFREASRATVFDRAAAAIRAGVGVPELLGAAFLAGIHDVRPRSVGSKLHCVMMIESAFQLVESAPAEEAWLAALWSIEDFKRSQDRDRREGEWVLPPRPDVSFPDEASARRELVAALDAWDAERADRAVVGLLPFHDGPSFFEILWPYAARSYVDIGHKIIFCTQVERALRRLGWRYAEPALRSLVNGLLYRDESLSPGASDVWNRSRELARRFPAGWLAGAHEASRSQVLATELRERDPSGAQQLVADAFRDNLAPATVWDGLRLFATEIFHRRPASAARRHGPVHPVTEVNAFAYVFRTSREDVTRRHMILQAAGWLPLLRDDMVRFFGAAEGPGLDSLGRGIEPGQPLPGMAELFQNPSPDTAFVKMETEPGTASSYLATLRRHLVERAFQSHQYKYAGAIVEESTLVDPRWASRILAPAVTYLPTPNDPATEVFDRSRRALRTAGVL